MEESVGWGGDFNINLFNSKLHEDCFENSLCCVHACHYFPSYQYIGVKGGVILLTMTMGE